MLIDLTLKITPKMPGGCAGKRKKSLAGHLGTNFDVMNKEFSLKAFFDIIGVQNRDIEA